MNVFWLDDDYSQSAQYMTDEHVGSKMIIEAAQIIGEALKEVGYDRYFLRGGYSTHPLTQWAAESDGNARKVARIASAMFEEKKHRYGGSHVSYVEGIEPLDWDEIEYGGEPTEPPYCVGSERFKHDGLVESYRHYYAVVKVDDSSSWTNRERPNWIDDYT